MEAAEAASEERLLQLWQCFCRTRSVTGRTACSRRKRKQCLRSAFYSFDSGSAAGLSYRQDCVLIVEAASVECLLQLWQWFCSWAQLQAGLRADGGSGV
ncbi:hypothetical protein NDU88_000217 [Pleurodeles waltl]|uniref:Uncharacterized protein n=1 Tax=Pleurodeles waltl TaxID=8319 RepID=A0AAV7P532_PLEWA|nr:hypothetical protein NDU88_000217 [Pleurodeles waltl]